MERNASFCENLYEPNPDIAGRGVTITFLAHSSCYIYLGLVITPVVHKFLSQLTPGQRAAAGAGNKPRDESSTSAPRGEPLSGSEPPPGSGDTRNGVRGFQPRSSEAIMAVFTGQYIVGLAYTVVAFIKRKEMSYYHLRIILGLCSINMAVALVNEYTRISLLQPAPLNRESLFILGRVTIWIRRLINMPPRKRISALGTIVLTIFYIGFMIYTSVMRGSDTNFQRCFPADRVLFPLTVVSSVAIVIPIVSSSKPKTFYMYRMSTWLVYLLFSTSVVIFHYVQLIYIMRAFRGPTGRMNPELEFGFGQLLIFFMILQLFVEFGMGLWSDLDYLHQAMSASDSSMPRSFVIFCSLLVPMLPGKLRQEILQMWYSGPKKLVHKTKQGIVLLLRRLSEWMSALSKKPLRKTKTIRVEAGPEDSSQQSLKCDSDIASNSDQALTVRPNGQARSSSDESSEKTIAPQITRRLTPRDSI